MSRPWRLVVAAAQVLFALLFTAGLYLYLLGLTPSLPALSEPRLAMPAPTTAPQREDRVAPPPAATQPPAVEAPAPPPPPPPASRGVVTVPNATPPIVVAAPLAVVAESSGVAQPEMVRSSKPGHQVHGLGPSMRSTSSGDHGPPTFARAAEPASSSRHA